MCWGAYVSPRVVFGVPPNRVFRRDAGDRTRGRVRSPDFSALPTRDSQHELWANAIRLPRNGCRNCANALCATLHVKGLGVWIGVDDDRGGAAFCGDLSSMHEESTTDTLSHKLGKHPKIIELPHLHGRDQRIEADNGAFELAHKGGARRNGFSANFQTRTPTFQLFTRIAPVRLRTQH